MAWHEWILEAPLFGGDKTYNAVVALIVFLAGAGLYFKTGNRLGWLFIAVALIWAFLTYQDLLFM